MTDNKKLKNKEAMEFSLINSGNTIVDVQPLERTNEPEHLYNNREIILEKLVKTIKDKDKIKDNSDKKIKVHPLMQIKSSLSNLSPIELNNLKSKFNNNVKFNINEFLKSLNINLDELNNNEISCIFDLFKLNGAKIKEYNNYGLPKDVDPEVLNYVTNAEFNPDTDIFIPAVLNDNKSLINNNLDNSQNKNQINDLDSNIILRRNEDFDIKREDLEEEYREVFDNLVNEENFDEVLIVKNKDNSNNNYNELLNRNNIDDKKIEGKFDDIYVMKNDINENNNSFNEVIVYKKKDKHDNDNNLPDNFILLANQGEDPIELKDDFDNFLQNIMGEEALNKKEDLNNSKNNDINKLDNLHKSEIAKNNNNINYKPSYKFISPEEAKTLNDQYKEVYKEYQGCNKSEPVNSINKNIIKENLKEALEEINSMLPSKNTIKTNEKKLETEINDGIHEGNEDYEEYEEDDDYENNSKNNFEDLDEKELENMKIKDGFDLTSKEQINKLVEEHKLNMYLKNKTNNFEIEGAYKDDNEIDVDEFLKDTNTNNKNNNKKNINSKENIKNNGYLKNKNKDVLTLTELDRITHNTDHLEKTMLMLENYETNNKSNDDNEVDLPELEAPRLYSNIINASNYDIETSNKNLPIKIENKNTYKKRPKNINTTMQINKTRQFNINNNIEESVLDKTNFEKVKEGNIDLKKAIIINKPKTDVKENIINNKKTEEETINKNELLKNNTEINNEKLENKLRKNKIKKENKERRENKKLLKTAFTTEKNKLKKVISDSNKTIRNGLSVKEIIS